MTINLSTPVKYVTSIGLTALLVAGTIYAENITSISQTAGEKDTITSSWVNAVNNGIVNAQPANMGKYMLSCGFAVSDQHIPLGGCYRIDTETGNVQQVVSRDGLVDASKQPGYTAPLDYGFGYGM